MHMLAFGIPTTSISTDQRGHCHEKLLWTNISKRTWLCPNKVSFTKPGSGRAVPLSQSYRPRTTVTRPRQSGPKAPHNMDTATGGGTQLQFLPTYLILQQVAGEVPVQLLGWRPGQSGRIFVHFDDLEEGWLFGD